MHCTRIAPAVKCRLRHALIYVTRCALPEVLRSSVPSEAERGQCSTAHRQAGSATLDSIADIQRAGLAACAAAFSFEDQFMIVNEDQIRGRLKEAEGKATEVAGKMAGNKKLELKGNVQRALGEAQAKFGDIRQKMRESQKAGASASRPGPRR
jgi:uncharacterized protein YjbJ (UPF0337 family)